MQELRIQIYFRTAKRANVVILNLSMQWLEYEGSAPCWRSETGLGSGWDLHSAPDRGVEAPRWSRPGWEAGFNLTACQLSDQRYSPNKSVLLRSASSLVHGTVQHTPCGAVMTIQSAVATSLQIAPDSRAFNEQSLLWWFFLCAVISWVLLSAPRCGEHQAKTLSGGHAAGAPQSSSATALVGEAREVNLIPQSLSVLRTRWMLSIYHNIFRRDNNIIKPSTSTGGSLIHVNWGQESNR